MTKAHAAKIQNQNELLQSKVGQLEATVAALQDELQRAREERQDMIEQRHQLRRRMALLIEHFCSQEGHPDPTVARRLGSEMPLEDIIP